MYLVSKVGVEAAIVDWYGHVNDWCITIPMLRGGGWGQGNFLKWGPVRLLQRSCLSHRATKILPCECRDWIYLSEWTIESREVQNQVKLAEITIQQEFFSNFGLWKYDVNWLKALMWLKVPNMHSQACNTEFRVISAAPPTITLVLLLVVVCKILYLFIATLDSWRTGLCKLETNRPSFFFWKMGMANAVLAILLAPALQCICTLPDQLLHIDA